jgi:hypothetical protein
LSVPSKLREIIISNLKEIGVKCEEIEKSVEGRFIRYECILGDHRFRFVVVVNGLNDVGGPSHKIEDHLVRLAGVNVQCDSKDEWNGLSEEKRLEVFRNIYTDRRVAEEVFKQHFVGLGLLDC